jgi:hypothetical protein
MNEPEQNIAEQTDTAVVKTPQPTKQMESVEKPSSTEAVLAETPVEKSTMSPIEPEASEPALPEEVPPPPQRKTLRLPNATVGRDYAVSGEKIAQSIPQPPDAPALRLIATRFPGGDIGLSFSSKTSQIAGNPTLAGELRFELEFQPEGQDAVQIYDAALTVNPDPTSLWKNKPSPVDGPYYKTEHRIEEMAAGELFMLAASQRGRSHAHEGTFRDDDFSLLHLQETDWWLVAVSDGAGSAKYSRRGSQLACDAAINHMRGFLVDANNAVDQALAQEGDEKPGLKTALYHLLPTAAYDAHKAIEAESKNPSVGLSSPPSMRDYAATLLLLALKKTPQGWFAASFAIGDGGAGCVMSDGAGVPLTKADGGDFAGQTMFVTMPGIFKPESLMARLEMRWLENFQALVVMTDGVTDPKFSSDAAFADSEKWRTFWDEVKTASESSPGHFSAEQMLEWLSFPSPGNHDDRTIVLIVSAAPSSDPA